MTERLVPTVRTTPTIDEFARALLRAWPDATAESAGVLWAQFALETGRGAHCYGWNLGNVKHVAGDGHDYHALRGVWEIINGKRVELGPNDPGSWFRSFKTLDDGMADHIAFLHGKRYAAVWPFVVAGNADAFARELSRRGYFTAPADDYARSLSAFHAAWMRSGVFADAVAQMRAMAEEAPTIPDRPVVIDGGTVHAMPEHPTADYSEG